VALERLLDETTFIVVVQPRIHLVGPELLALPLELGHISSDSDRRPADGSPVRGCGRPRKVAYAQPGHWYNSYIDKRSRLCGRAAARRSRPRTDTDERPDPADVDSNRQGGQASNGEPDTGAPELARDTDRKAARRGQTVGQQRTK